MAAPTTSPRKWLSETAGEWDRFWFTPTDPATLGVIRILAGGDALLHPSGVELCQLTDFFGEHGWLPLQELSSWCLRDSYLVELSVVVSKRPVLAIVHILGPGRLRSC